MDWRIKGVVQGVLARLPGGTAVNDRLQRLAGGRADQGAHIDAKFEDDWLVLMDVLRELDFAVRDRVLLEIGTGWLPVLPLCFALAGARRVETCDLDVHLHPEAVAPTLRRLERHLDALARAAGEPQADVRRRFDAIAAGGDGERMLARAGIRYHAPADATRLALADGDVALVFSNSVLEHVHAAVLDPLMQVSARLLAPGGLVLHSVNCGDHYAYFDRRITPIHYLRFDERRWRRWNNALLFQNRLRPSDFVAAAQRAGLALVHRSQTVRRDLLERLPTLPVAAQFRHYDATELCTTSVTFAARRGE